MIIDAHLHFFHDKIASTTINELKNIAKIEPTTLGNRASSEEYLKKNYIDKAFLLNIATKAKNNVRINDFAISNNDDKFISFGSINPYFAGYEEELDRLVASGIKGIKFHPQYQNFDLGDKAHYPIYKAAEKRNLLMSFHMGFDPYVPDCDFAAPKKLAQIAREINPKLIIAAHFGGYLCWEEVLKDLSKSNVNMDTSIGLYHTGSINIDVFKRILDNLGIDNLIFASDTPWGRFNETINFINDLGLSEKEKEKVFYQNALRLLKLMN